MVGLVEKGLCKFCTEALDMILNWYYTDNDDNPCYKLIMELVY